MITQFNAPIWGDEGFSAILSMKSLPEIFKIISRDTSPPLWNLFEWAVFNTLGTSEIYIRGLAFSFFLLTIFFVYKIGTSLWDRNTGIIASILTFLNPFFFIYAFEGRMYSIMSAGVAGSFYFFSQIIFVDDNKKINKLHLFGYVFFTLWALYSHHFAIFALITQGVWFLYLLLKKDTAVKTIFIGFIGVVLGYLPWLPILYSQTKMVGGGFWLGKPTFHDLTNLITEYLAYGIRHSLSFSAFSFVLVIFAARKWRKDIKETILLSSWFLMPIVLAWVISQIFQPVFYNRYLLYTIPAAMILLASNHRRFGQVLITGLIIIFAIVDAHYFTHPTKLPFNELSQSVTEMRQDGDYFINWNDGAHHLWETKYYGIEAPIYIGPDGSLPYFVGTALMEDKDIVREIPENAKRVGVITSGSIEAIKLPGYTEIARRNFDRLKIVWYVKSENNLE